MAEDIHKVHPKADTGGKQALQVCGDLVYELLPLWWNSQSVHHHLLLGRKIIFQLNVARCYT